MGNNAYKQRHKDQGLCGDCSRPALPGQTRCIIHNENNRARIYKSMQKNYDKKLEYNRKRKQIYRETNRCMSCGAPLGEQDESFTHCVNCRDKKFQAILSYPRISGDILEDYYKKIASQP